MAEKFSGNLRKPPGNVGSSSEISANLPTTLAARRRFPQTSQQRWQLVGDFRKPPNNAGSSSEISANLPTTLAARRRFPQTSRQRWQLVGDFRRRAFVKQLLTVMKKRRSLRNGSNLRQIPYSSRTCYQAQA
ncbi:hypothetical protein [Parabacteroides sp. An277]|uniref:hypothetical protein n=1 Tax=Parabacteroides sp. An277 TaxID=1965619 RepID=UPI0011202B7B|nr:hypothetical protein [Parabacteroides sp. An277]